MGINFSFNSFGNSTQNNAITVNYNDIDKLLEHLKEVNIPSSDISELKTAIELDKKETSKMDSVGINVQKWCLSIFEKVTSGLIVNTTLPIVKEKIASILSTIYQFPVQF